MSISFVFSLISIFLLIIFLFLSLLRYQNTFHLKFDMRNMFPFEVNFKQDKSRLILTNILLILSTLMGIAFYILFSSTHSGIHILILVAGIMAISCNTLLVFINTTFLRSHLLLMIFAYVSNFALAAGIFYNAYKINSDILLYPDTNQNLIIVSMVIAIISGLLVFVLLMNPKLSLNTNAKIKEDVNGNKIYERPKFIVMAFSEWLLIFAQFLSQIALIFYIISC